MSSPSPSIPSDTLLLCVDVQPKVVAALPLGVQLRRRCEFAVSAAVGLGLPVAFTEQVPDKLGHTAPELLNRAPQAAVWSKTAFSALADDTIRDLVVRQRDVHHLLLCGIETPVCIYQTAIGALGLGLHVTILCDCVSARRAEDARVCLEALTRAGAHVLPSESVFYAMLRDANHPFFRGYTQLVKLFSETPAL